MRTAVPIYCLNQHAQFKGDYEVHDVPSPYGCLPVPWTRIDLGYNPAVAGPSRKRGTSMRTSTAAAGALPLAMLRRRDAPAFGAAAGNAEAVPPGLLKMVKSDVDVSHFCGRNTARGQFAPVRKGVEKIAERRLEGRKYHVN